MSRCDRCQVLLDDVDHYFEDDAGCWCEECVAALDAESLAAVGGRALIEAEVRLNREAREQEGVL